ncbi:MAG: hypothetical protein MK212_05425 [Saprospiraceae bacterium]|nr:hypothetical protein [Saprospiraceae bacterium]
MDNTTNQIEHCDLCIIGLGIAGLNALNSSVQYLNEKSKIIVVDKRPKEKAVGGMWNTTYPFVRLHQPHPFFTVGNNQWNWDKDARYLATGQEVVEHLSHCYQQLKSRYNIVERFAYESKSYHEIETTDGHEAQIELKSTNDDSTLIIRAKRCINAIGLNIKPNTVLQLSSPKVRSIAPEDKILMTTEVANDDKPIYMVGGGKTSMDVANQILTQNPNRKINFLVGRGTFFINRDIAFPKGMRKYWAGRSLTNFLLSLVTNFEEDNLDPAIDHVIEKYALNPFHKARQTFLGILSPEEVSTVMDATDQVLYEYLQDVKEENGALLMQFKSGQKQAIEEGSWLINCTGHLLREENKTVPIISKNKTIISIQDGSRAFIFSSFAGYFLPHLWFNQQFDKVPFIYFNHSKLKTQDKKILLFAIAAQSVYNLIRLVEALPRKIMKDFGLNFDNWFPFYRQFVAIFKILGNKKKYLARCEYILNYIDAKYEVDLGLLGRNE